METTLHRQLKSIYCADPERQEIRVDGYRIDAVTEAGLIEIQQAGLSALRRKALALLESHPLTIVKPLVARRVLIKRLRRGGPVHSTRTSPRHDTVFDLFEDLVHFVDVFPHPRLSLHVLLTEQEEHRIVTAPRRRRDKGYRVDDRRLLGIVDRYQLRTREDLRALLPETLPETFSTADIARHAEIPRWLSQKAAYCLRMTGVAEIVGKSRNTRLYRWSARLPRAA